MRTITTEKMKCFAAICFSFIMVLSLNAQTGGVPSKMSYQAVVRDGTNSLLVNKTVGTRISILQSSATGRVVYKETHSTATNTNGLMSIAIGDGRVEQGAMALIDWAQGPFFIKTEIDPSGGNSYTIVSTTQLLTVPFALYAEKAGNGFDGDYESLTNKPTLSNVAVTGEYTDLQGRPNLATVAESGEYADLTGRPTLADVAESGSYTDLQDKPVLTKVATTGNYTDLQGIPTLAEVAISGSYTKLKDTPIFATVAETGSYKSLKDTLELAKVARSGSYDDLTNKPTISYNLLADKPIIPAKVSQLENDLEYLKKENLKLKIENNSLSLTDDNGSLNTVTLPSGNGGDYNTLINKPEGTNDGDILYWNKSTVRWNILPMGAEGQVLSVINGALGWKTLTNIGATANYQVGDIYYEEKKPAGVVIEVSQAQGYGKIISLTEFTGLQWSTEEVVTNATDKENGIENLKRIKGITDWETKYPAFKTSSSLGEGWYIPSKGELSTIYVQKEIINDKLNTIQESQEEGSAAIIVNTLAGDAYWSSSEENDKNATALAFKVIGENTAGSPYALGKKELCSVRPIRLLSRQEITDKPVEQEKVYAVGDLYKDESGEAVGIVYEITYNGLHGKMVSIAEAETQWSTILNASTARSINDGQANQQAVKDSLDFYPSFKFAADLGEGWYLPSKEELETVYQQKQGINLTLTSVAGSRLLKDNFYWSSTWQGKSYSMGTAFGNYTEIVENEGSEPIEIPVETGTSFEAGKAEVHYVRAIREF